MEDLPHDNDDGVFNGMFNKELDSFLTSNVHIDFKDLTPEQQEVQKQIARDCFTQAHKLRKQANEIEQSGVKLLVEDPDKYSKLNDALTKTHGDILDIDDSEHDVSVGGLPDVIAYLHPIVEHKCNIQHDSTLYRDYYGKDYHYNHIEFITENRNQKVYTSGDIFDEFKSHPEQKRLVKGKHINKRAMKKQKTVFQHLNTLVQAKGYDNLVKRMEATEKEVKHMKQELTLVKVNLSQITKDIMLHKQRTTGLEIDQEELKQQVYSVNAKYEELESVVKDSTKRMYMAMYLNFKEQGSIPPNKEFAKIMGVQKRTIQRWKKELGLN